MRRKRQRVNIIQQQYAKWRNLIKAHLQGKVERPFGSSGFIDAKASKNTGNCFDAANNVRNENYSIIYVTQVYLAVS